MKKLLIIFSKKKKNKRAMMALGHSPEYHWNQIISKSVHWFSRRSLLKLFSIYSPGGHFVQIHLLIQEKKSFKVFLFLALAAILFDRVEQFEQFW